MWAALSTQAVSLKARQGISTLGCPVLLDASKAMDVLPQQLGRVLVPCLSLFPDTASEHHLLIKHKSLASHTQKAISLTKAGCGLWRPFFLPLKLCTPQRTCPFPESPAESCHRQAVLNSSLAALPVQRELIISSGRGSGLGCVLIAPLNWRGFILDGDSALSFGCTSAAQFCKGVGKNTPC